MRVRLTRVARAELEESAWFYERRRASLGVEFQRTVRATFELIADAPLIGALIADLPPDSSARRVLVSRFPHWVVYQLTPQGVLVLAIAHTSREPSYWVGRPRS